MKLDNTQKSNVLLSFWGKIVTKAEVKQRKFASCLIEKKERGGRGRGGLMEKAGTAKWRWAAITAFLLQGQVVLRWRRLHKEYCQRQEFRHSKGQTLASCEQKVLMLASKVGIPERPKEEKVGKIRLPDFSCICSYWSIFCPSPHSKAENKTLFSLGIPIPISTPTPLLVMPPKVHWNYSCQTLSSSSSPVLYTSLFKWAVEEIKMNLYWNSLYFFEIKAKKKLYLWYRLSGKNKWHWAEGCVKLVWVFLVNAS